MQLNLNRKYLLEILNYKILIRRYLNGLKLKFLGHAPHLKLMGHDMYLMGHDMYLMGHTGTTTSPIQLSNLSTWWSLGARVPLFFTLLFHTVVSWLQIHIIIYIRHLQVTHVGCFAIKLYIITATLSLNPASCRPLTDAPRGGPCRTSQIIAILTPVVTSCITPAPLSGEFPEWGAF